MTMIEPLIEPAIPRPWIARPRMMDLLFGAAAAGILPIMINANELRNTHLALQYLYNFPHDAEVAATMKNVADPYHPTSLRERNSSVICGIAVEMMPISSAVRRAAMLMESMIRKSLKPSA